LSLREQEVPARASDGVLRLDEVGLRGRDALRRRVRALHCGAVRAAGDERLRRLPVRPAGGR
jgi:hypothetical protein